MSRNRGEESKVEDMKEGKERRVEETRNDQICGTGE